VRHLCCAVILVALATTGCLSSGILYEARKPSVNPRTITGVTRAVVDGDRVIIGLVVRRDDRARPEHLDVEIPLRDLDWARDHAVEGKPDISGFVFARPPRGALRKTSSVEEGTPIDIEPFDLARLDDLAGVRDRLPSGLHVLLLQQAARPGEPARSIPALLDTRDGHDGYGVVLDGLPGDRAHRKALLLLMPLAAPIDVVTFPLQILFFVLTGEC
jgi:hypothetical protein